MHGLWLYRYEILVLLQNNFLCNGYVFITSLNIIELQGHVTSVSTVASALHLLNMISWGECLEKEMGLYATVPCLSLFVF